MEREGGAQNFGNLRVEGRDLDDDTEGEEYSKGLYLRLVRSCGKLRGRYTRVSLRGGRKGDSERR